MYKYIKNKEINYSLWNTCINKAPNGLIYALSWYLDTVSKGWDAIIKEENDEYIAVFPVTKFKKFTFNFLTQPHFVQQLGLIHREEKIPKQEYFQVAEILDKEFDYISNYNFNIGNYKPEMPSSFKVQNLKTYHLDLSLPYNKIFENYKKDKKYRLSLAKKAGLKLCLSTDIDGLITMFNDNIAYKIQGVKDNQEIYSILIKVYKKALDQKMASLYEVKTIQNELLGAALFLEYKNSIVYFFSALTVAGRKSNAMIFLLDSVINKYSGQQLILDFEGSHVPGIADFYSRFGATRKDFITISKNNLPLFIKIIKLIRSDFTG